MRESKVPRTLLAVTSGLPRTSSGFPPLARSPEEWVDALRPLGGRRFHAQQLFRWIHARGVLDPAKMTDLPGALRAGLTALSMERAVTIVDERRALDGTRKLLVRLADGASVETVLIPGVSGAEDFVLPSPVGRLAGPADDTLLEDADAAAAADDADEEPEERRASATETKEAGPFVRVTQCVSTQVGCAMGCTFCASGVAGFKRHLGADEIVAQVIAGRCRLEGHERLRNVVFMGMGEPLHNYEATARALRLLTHHEGIALSARRVTVSTSGLVPEIARLGADFNGNIGLAVSLHAADDETRSRLMPINKKYPLAALMTALRAYPLPRRRRITIEYTLVAGQNDSLDEATKLARLLRGLPVKINLIPMNPITASALGPPPMAGVLRFQQVLCDSGYSCFIRRRRGDDVSAACGQLALLGAKPKIRNRLLASR
ncbi:MAG: 23S rRNA (adenine(2503)-C(2))-methyltransferase RlmN [Myxococcota bacterium]|nr:23S rRNA (adenine(2503)-C(2))-methyltransferase RlmN [Myxococcota bacterium]